MIIIRFRGKYIVLDSFQLGIIAYVVTLGLMTFIEWRRNRKKGPFSKFLRLRGGGNILLQTSFYKRFKKNTLYKISDPNLILYLRQLKDKVNSSEISFVELQTLAYAMRTQNKMCVPGMLGEWRIKIINMAKVSGSITTRSTLAIMIHRIFHSLLISFGSISVVIVLFTLPYRYWNYDIAELPVNQENIQYLLKDPKVGEILIYFDEVPEFEVYRKESTIILDKENDESLVLKDKPLKERKFNRQVKTLRDLQKTITVADSEESIEDASWIVNSKETERMRIRIGTPNPDFK